MKPLSAFILAVSLVFLLSACDTPEEQYENYINSAHEYFAEGEYNKAKLEYKNAALIMPADHRVLYYLGLVEEAQGELQKALSAYLTSERQSPDYVPVKLKLAGFYLTAGVFDEVTPRVNRLLQIDPNNAMAHALQGSLFLAQKRLKEAQKSVDTAMNIDPKNILGFSVQVGIYNATGQQAEALKTLDIAIANYPNELSYRLLQAAIYNENGDIDAVSGIYKNMFDLAPEFINLRFDLAQLLIEHDRFEDAETVLREIIRNFPSDTEAKKRLLTFLEDTQTIENVEKQLNTFIKDFSQNAIFKLWLADLYVRTGRQIEATTLLQTIIDENQDTESIFSASNRLAKIYIEDGQLERAESIVKEVLLNDVGNAEALLIRAAINFERKNLEEAITDLRQIIEEGADNPIADKMLAEIFLEQRRTDLAIDTLIQASKKYPTDTEILIRIAQLYAHDDNFERAERILLSLFKTDGDNPILLETYARMLSENDQLLKALESVERLSSIPGKENIAAYLQGSILQKQGESETSRAIFYYLIENDPTSSVASYALGSLMESVENTADLQIIVNFLHSLENKNSFIFTVLGDSEKSLGHVEFAKKAYQEAILLNPNSQKAYLGLAETFLQEGSISQAEDVLTNAQNVDPTEIESSLLLAQIMVDDGRSNEALLIYSKLVDAHPQSDIAINNYAQTIADFDYNNSASLERAKILAERFINSDNPYFLDTLGWVYFRSGLLTQAEAVLSQSLKEIGQPNPQIAYHYGATLKSLGRSAEAKKYLIQALDGEDYPGKKEAVYLLTDLE